MSLSKEEVATSRSWPGSASATQKPGRPAQLNEIFELIGKMQQVDTEGVEPMSHAHGSACVCARIKYRGDQREQFQSVAPQVEAGLYLVPKVIE